MDITFQKDSIIVLLPLKRLSLYFLLLLHPLKSYQFCFVTGLLLEFPMKLCPNNPTHSFQIASPFLCSYAYDLPWTPFLVPYHSWYQLESLSSFRTKFHATFFTLCDQPSWKGLRFFPNPYSAVFCYNVLPFWCVSHFSLNMTKYLI